MIAIAGGPAKAPAIVAAIRGRYFNTLTTDDGAAERMLQLREACRRFCAAASAR